MIKILGQLKALVIKGEDRLKERQHLEDIPRKEERDKSYKLKELKEKVKEIL